MSRELQKAYWEGYRKGYIDGFSKSAEVENSPTDGRNAEEWINISAEEVGAETPDFREEISKLWDSISFLEGRIKKLERAFYG